jgi:hypothetical protein
MECVVDDRESSEPYDAFPVDGDEQSPFMLGPDEASGSRSGSVGNRCQVSLAKEPTCLHLQARQCESLVRMRLADGQPVLHAGHPITAGGSGRHGRRR